MHQQSPKLKIPTYAADGTRRRDYPLHSCERLEQRGLMVLERNRRGHVVCATFRPEKLDSHSRLYPIKGSIPTGTYYSRREQIAGHKVWELRDTLKERELEQIIGKAVDEEDLDSFQRGVFCAVALSIIPPEDHPEANRGLRAARDVSLGTGKPHEEPRRKRGKKARVIEFPKPDEHPKAPGMPVQPAKAA